MVRYLSGTQGQVRRKNSATRSLVHYMGTIVCAIVRHNPTVDDAMANKNTALDNFHGLNKCVITMRYPARLIIYTHQNLGCNRTLRE